MPSEKQIEAFARYRRKQIAELRPYIEGEDVSHVSISPEDVKAGSPKRGDMIARNPKNHDDQWLVARAYFLDNFEALTAAEQAEPLDNDAEIHRWQRATAVQSRKLQMVLDIPGVKERLQEITGSPDEYMLAGIEQAEPAPAARSGAVKSLTEDDYEEIINAAAVKMRKAASGVRGQVITVQDSLDWWVMKETEQANLAALEPAEPATDVEPVAWLCEDQIIVENRSVTLDGEFAAYRAKYSDAWKITPLFTRPPESRLREALEKLLAPFADDPCRLDHHGYCQAHFLELHCCVAKARAALAQEDGR